MAAWWQLPVGGCPREPGVTVLSPAVPILPAEARTRASRREILALVVYFTGLVLLTDVLNVRLGVELMSLAVFVAAVVISRRPLLFLHDWWFLLLGLLLWNVGGPIAAYSPFPLHLDFMLNLDRILGFGHQPVAVVQHAFARPGTITPLDYFTAILYNLHVPEPYIAGYFLWRLGRAVYLQYAAAVLMLLVAGFITFILFPSVPPWMASTRLHRLSHVYNGFGPVLRSYPMPFHGTPLFYLFKWRGDAVAAFPSEHAAFPMLDLLAFSRISPRLIPWFVLWVALVLFTILYLGEHWVTDALFGWLYTAVIFFAVRKITT